MENIKLIEKKIEDFLKCSSEKENLFKNKITYKFIQEFNEDFFIYRDLIFNTDNLVNKRNEINYILELIIMNNKYNEFDVEILNCLVNYIDEYMNFLINQEIE